MLDRIRLWGRLVGNVLPFIVKTCIIITGYCAIASAVYAQNSNPALEAARQHEQRLQQEQLRLQEEQQFRQPTVDIFLHPDGVEESNEKALASGRCFDIHTVQLEGVTRYNESVQQSWISPFIDQCLDLSRINELLKLVTHRYIEDGFVTSRAFLQPQNLSEGELTILVLEGRLESIESVEGSLSSRQLYLAFPTRDGHLLNLRDLEQGLEQLNRLQQNRAEMDNTLDKNYFSGIAYSNNQNIPTFFINGAPVQAGTMKDSVEQLGFVFSGSSANPNDSVAELLGRNRGSMFPL